MDSVYIVLIMKTMSIYFIEIMFSLYWGDGRKGKSMFWGGRSMKES